ncbi:hypothetical protein MJL33_32045, partial [Salmonella enterica subsp. enterica serovar Kentucky]|nr:hypothetical protein [Salmonella enterica subsp. enterica serovar Kentucky]
TGVVNRAGTQVRQFAYENGLMTAHSNAAGFTCRYRWQELDGALVVLQMFVGVFLPWGQMETFSAGGLLLALVIAIVKLIVGVLV